jgi:hypothetical protein
MDFKSKPGVKSGGILKFVMIFHDILEKTLTSNYLQGDIICGGKLWQYGHKMN